MESVQWRAMATFWLLIAPPSVVACLRQHGKRPQYRAANRKNYTVQAAAETIPRALQGCSCPLSDLPILETSFTPMPRPMPRHNLRDWQWERCSPTSTCSGPANFRYTGWTPWLLGLGVLSICYLPYHFFAKAYVVATRRQVAQSLFSMSPIRPFPAVCLRWLLSKGLSSSVPRQ